MTLNVSNVDITVDTFSVMVTRVNQMADGFKNHTVTIDTSASGNNSSGNGFITGVFGANTLVVGTGLRGGSVSQAANLNVISNTTFQSNVVFLSSVTLSSNLISNAYVSFANSISVTGNVVFSNTLSVTGNSIFSNTVSITGNTILANTLMVTGNVLFSNTLSVVGNSNFSNTLFVTGNTTLANSLIVTGNTALSNTLNVTGNVFFANTLSVIGNVALSNTLTIGYNTPVTVNSLGVGIQSAVQLSGASAGDSSILIMRYSNNTNSSRLILGKSRNGVPGLPGNVAYRDYLGRLTFVGDTNTQLLETAVVAARVLGTVSDNEIPTGLVFITSATERLVIDQSGNVGIGDFSSTTLPNAKLQVSGTANVSGNITLAENLIVVGNTTHTGLIIVTGNTSLANTLTVIGNSRFSNTITVTGNATFSNTITVTGNAIFSNTVTINTLIVTGNTNIDTGTLFIDNINDRIGIGNTSPDAKLTVTGAANVSGNVTIGGGLTVVGNTVFDDKVIFLTDVEMYNGRFISPVWVQTSDANAAIKITQAGSGHALYVEDQTSPDSTPTVITNAGNFVAGGNTALTIGTAVKIQALVDSGGSFLAAATANLSNQGARYVFYKTRSSNVETYSAVANGDQIGRLDFYADDGGQPIEAARIMVMNNGTPGPNSMPSAIHFYTTGESSNSALTSGPRLSIVANGNVGVGIGTPTEKLYINGNLRTIGNAVFSAQVTITGNTTIDSGTFVLDTVLNTVGIGAPTPNTKFSVAGPIALSVPVKVSATSYTVTTTDASVIFDTTANCNVIMPDAATYPGRILYVKTIAARTINSTSASIKPIDSNTAANNILTNVAGKFAMLQSDGSNWVIMMNN